MGPHDESVSPVPEPGDPAAVPTEAHRARRRGRAMLAATFLLPALLFGYARCVEPLWIEVTEHEVDLRGALADGHYGSILTVLHVTDLHVVRIGRRERSVLALADEIAPDLIVLTGDSVGPDYDPADLRELLGGLHAPLGTFACLGNWEEWTDEASAVAAYEEAGVRLLRGEVATVLGGRLALGGVDRAGSHLPPRPGSATASILLCHYPAVLPRAADAGWDLVLAGHTHGGQVRVPLLGPLILPFDSAERDRGWFDDRGTRLYVSRGIGTSVIPVRFLCRPELAVHRLQLRVPAGGD